MSSKKKHKRPWPVFIAIILAIIVGSLLEREHNLFGVSLYSIFEVLGNIFLNALTLVVVPLGSSSIITGIARIGGDQSFGRLGLKMFSFYIGTSLIAVLIGLFFVNVIHPGSPETLSAAGPAEQAVIANLHSHLDHAEGKAFVDVLMQIIPSNIVAAFSQTQMLGLIFFSLLFGYAISKIDSHPSSILQGFWQGIFQAMIKITHIVMRFLPYGVFCLVAKVFMTAGIKSLGSLALFFLTVILGLATFMLVGLSLLLQFVGRVKPGRHLKAMAPAFSDCIFYELPLQLHCQ